MTNNTYIRWDYDQNIATEFSREGDCNRCGQCCRAIINFKATVHPELGPNAVYEDEDIRNGGTNVYADDDGVIHGIWNEVINERGERRFFQITEINTDAIAEGHKCSSLQGEGNEHSCDSHFDKTLICKGWPFAPEQVTPFPECSYSFEEVRRWTIEEGNNGDQ